MSESGSEPEPEPEPDPLGQIDLLSHQQWPGSEEIADRVVRVSQWPLGRSSGRHLRTRLAARSFSWLTSATSYSGR